MTISYLNGSYIPMDEARISPMDRGFLFGDGVYEVIPYFDRRAVGFKYHIERLNRSLATVEIPLNWSSDRWRELCETLVRAHWASNVSVYLQVTRGADSKRAHAYPNGLTPTIYGFAFDIPAAVGANREAVKVYRVSTQRDRRWRHCDVKATSLLGNLMHFQFGRIRGHDETLLFNADGSLTEASTSNVFVVKDGAVVTPPLSDEILPGVTRRILLEVLRADGSIPVNERPIQFDEVMAAEEVWLTSSSKEVVPVVQIDGQPVGAGAPGVLWERAQTLFTAGKFNY